MKTKLNQKWRDTEDKNKLIYLMWEKKFTWAMNPPQTPFNYLTQKCHKLS
jgi:hypothetical protein